MKCVIYTRVSSDAQVEKGVSLDAQLEKCRIYCQFKDMEVVDVITDEGVSAWKTDKRPGFVQMMKMVSEKS